MSRGAERAVRAKAIGCTLTELMARLDLGGWNWKLRSKVVDGERVYTATVFHAEEGWGGRKKRSLDPVEALVEAWVDCVYRRRRWRPSEGEDAIEEPPPERGLSIATV